MFEPSAPLFGDPDVPMAAPIINGRNVSPTSLRRRWRSDIEQWQIDSKHWIERCRLYDLPAAKEAADFKLCASIQKWLPVYDTIQDGVDMLLPKLQALADEEHYAACDSLKQQIDALCTLQKNAEQRLADLSNCIESTGHFDIRTAVDKVLHKENVCCRSCTVCKERRQKLWVAVKPYVLPVLAVLFAMVVVASKALLPVSQPTWTDVIGAPHFVAEGGVMQKKLSGQSREWDSGASSAEMFMHSSWREQGVEWTATTDGAYLIGLNSKDLQEEEKVHFALLCRKDGTLSIVEKRQGHFDDDEILPNRIAYKPGDKLAVKVRGTTVTYHLDSDGSPGQLLYTSKRRPVFPLVVDAEFRDPGARADGVGLVWGWG
jgi:hypothetical protein